MLKSNKQEMKVKFHFGFTYFPNSFFTILLPRWLDIYFLQIKTHRCKAIVPRYHTSQNSTTTTTTTTTGFP